MSDAARVLSVHRSDRHDFSKQTVEQIMLLAGLGVEGDTHAGTTVQHRSRVRRDPTQPNLRQVHLIHAELHDRLARCGFEVAAGSLGENVTTSGIDLLDLATGTCLRLGPTAVVRVMGLRNPCVQIENFRAGLLAEVMHDDAGRVARTAGVMAVVLAGGPVRPGDEIEVIPPDGPHLPLTPV